jgi:hypothetical protein
MLRRAAPSWRISYSGQRRYPATQAELADFGQVFDRSQFLSRESLASELDKPGNYQ